jgi:ubiquinol-cytochrome c reductase cytochrome c subunit
VSADAPRPALGSSRRAARALLVLASVLGAAVGLNLLFGPGDARAQEGEGEGEGLGAQWASDEALVDRGAGLFGAHCALCHGESGRGLQQPGPQAGPTLVGVGAASVDFMIRTGRMPMSDARDRLRRGPQRFDDEDRRALVAFVESLAPGEGPDLPEVDHWQQGDLALGLELFTRNCAACHGPTAQGIAVGRRDVSSTLDVADPIEIAQAVRSGPGVMPRFLGDTMDDEELLAVTAWVMELRDREAPGGWSFGRSGPVAEGFIAIVLGLGLLGVIMYLLGERHHDEEDRDVPVTVRSEGSGHGDA